MIITNSARSVLLVIYDRYLARDREINRGYYTAARTYEFYFRVVQTILLNHSNFVKMPFSIAVFHWQIPVPVSQISVLFYFFNTLKRSRYSHHTGEDELRE